MNQKSLWGTEVEVEPKNYDSDLIPEDMQMDDFREMMEGYEQLSKDNTIDEFKEEVRDQDGEFNWRLLKAAEENADDRKGIKRWLNAIIKGDITYEQDVLTYRDKLSVWKSAVQKYIRRGMVKETVESAANMNKLNSESLSRRLVVMVMEDAWGGVAALGEVNNPIKLASILADNPKDKKSCWGDWQIEKFDDKSLDELKENEDNSDIDYRNFYRSVYQECKENSVPHWLANKNDISRRIKRRMEKGFHLDNDFDLAVSSLIRIWLGDYNSEYSVPEVEEEWIEDWKEEVHWYAVDGHTSLGARAIGIVSNKFDELEYDELKIMTFLFAGSKIEGESDPMMEENRSDYDKELWDAEVEFEVKDAIQYIAEDYNIEVIE